MTNAQTGLPDFMEGHVLVAFHRQSTPEERMAARGALTDREAELTDQLDGMNESGGDYITDDIAAVDSVEKADGVTSVARVWLDEKQFQQVEHRPVLDIDFPAALVPSATPGHFHLYLDKVLSHDKYMFLLNALAEVGIIEEGYERASQERGYSSARLPTKPKVID